MADCYDASGPPIVSNKTCQTTKKRKLVTKPNDSAWRKKFKPRNIHELEGPNHLVASEVPAGFPPALAFRALAAYAFLRTLSRELRLSPFTPNAFLRALNLQYPSRLLGQAHVALLRILLPNMGYSYRQRGMSLFKKRKVDGFRWHLRAGDNLTYLDSYTWPIFYDDYIHLTADIIAEKLRDTTNHIDFRSLALNNQSDTEDFEEEKTKDSENMITQVSRVRGFGLPTRQGRGLPRQSFASNGSNPKTKPAPFQPLKRKLMPEEDSVSDASQYSEDTDEDDEDFLASLNTRGRIPLSRAHSTSAQTSDSAIQIPNSSDSQSPLSGSALLTYPSHHLGQFQSGAIPMPSTYQFTHAPTNPYDRGDYSKQYDSCNQNSTSKAEVTPQPCDYIKTLPSAKRYHHLDPPLSGPENTQSRSSATPSCYLQSTMVQTEHLSKPVETQSFTAVPLTSRPTTTRPSFSHRSNTMRPGTAPMLYNQSRGMIQIPRPGVATLPQMIHRPQVRSAPSSNVLPRKSKSGALVVPDKVADCIEMFKQKSGPDVAISSSNSENTAQPSHAASKLNEEKESEYNSSNIRPKASKLEDEDRWAHFTPVELMRDGVPYHRLPLLQKLQILEFLIDELLNVDFIAAEFKRREVITSCYLNPFGMSPSEVELKALENADECGVCAQEGDLICCDGCPSSYHRRCLGMDPRTVLPDGKWLCAECQIKDPAHYGSLKDDRKSSVDWFKINDIKKMNREASPSSHLVNRNSVFQTSTSGQGCYQIQHIEQEATSANSKATNNGMQETENGYCNVEQAKSVEKPTDVKEDEFIVIYGYVFRRPCLLSGRDSCDTLDKFKSLKNASISGQLLLTEELHTKCLSIGPKLFSQWPLVQIPLRPKKLWESSGCKPDNMMRYLSTNTFFDPSKYTSAYRLAPLPKSYGSGAQHPELVLADYESKCHNVETKMLAVHLTADMSSDRSISEGLRVGTSLFNPYRMICSYLEKLEHSLSRAGLLAESWGLRNKDLQQNMWIRNVQRCRSIPRLSKLLILLVDAAHPLSFNEEWFENQHNRSTKKDDSLFDEKPVYDTLPNDWTPEMEMLKRKWETCSDSNILSLLAEDSMNLSQFLDGAALRNCLIGRKRKVVEFPKSQVKIVELQSNSIGPSFVPNALSPDPEINKSNTSDQVSEARGRRLRRGRDCKITDMKAKNVSSCASIKETVERARARKIKDIEKMLSTPPEKEINWPVCGRYFFDPIAYLPAREMRRLGRNAGATVAPHMAYLNSHEVAQGAFCHIWRKWCLDCDSFERLLFLIRCLQSFLNQDMISACEGAVRRYGGPKAFLAKNISCSRRDLSSGELEYFILHKSKNRGCWVPFSKVDASVFILERERRADKFRSAWSKKKAEAEKKRTIEETTLQLQLKAKRKAESQALIALQAKRRAEEKAAAARELAQKDAERQKASAFELRQIQRVQAEMLSLLQRHENDTFQLLLAFITPEMEPVPEGTMSRLRVNNLQKLKQLNAKLEAFDGPTFKSEKLQAMVEEREKLASEKFKMLQGTNGLSPANQPTSQTSMQSPANANWQQYNQNERQGNVLGQLADPMKIDASNPLPAHSISRNTPEGNFHPYASQPSQHHSLNQMTNDQSLFTTQQGNNAFMLSTPIYQDQFRQHQHLQHQQQNAQSAAVPHAMLLQQQQSPQLILQHQFRQQHQFQQQQQQQFQQQQQHQKWQQQQHSQMQQLQGSHLDNPFSPTRF